jgi:formimidoylglutamate deiminase
LSILHAARALTPEGWRSDVRIAIEGPRIAAIEVGVSPRHGDERHGVAVPGVANVHSHAFQRAMAGLAEIRGEGTDTFWTWRETMYRFALAMSPDDVEAVAAQAYVEMLESGFTAVGEFHYLHHAPDGSPYQAPGEMAARVLAAAREVGIGMTLLPVFYAHATFGGALPKPEQRRFITDVAGFARLLEDCRRQIAGRPGDAVGVAPHSLRAATPSELSEIVALARDSPIHIHVAEQAKEVEDCVAWSGARPVRWLLDHADVDDRWCLVHATHMDRRETQDAARSLAVAGLCPVTEANLGDGFFDAPAFIVAEGRYGVGTDSNVSIGVAGELRQLEYAQRLNARARNVLAPPGGSSGRAMLDAVWRGGGQALARTSGRLAPGAIADVLTLRTGHPTFAGKVDDQMLDAWIFSVGAEAVDYVWSAGHKVVAEGRHVARERVAARFTATMRKLATR